MVFEILHNSETLLVVATILLLIPIGLRALYSKSPDAHLEFFFNLMEGFPKGTES